MLRFIRTLFTPTPRRAPAGCMAALREGRALLVDVREAGEWNAGVARSAVLLPLADLRGPRTRWRPFLAAVGDREILLYCASGLRSGYAARVLAAEGFRVANTGGLGDWAEAGWPVVVPGR